MMYFECAFRVVAIVLMDILFQLVFAHHWHYIWNYTCIQLCRIALYWFDNYC